jgi:hypothetical protein
MIWWKLHAAQKELEMSESLRGSPRIEIFWAPLSVAVEGMVTTNSGCAHETIIQLKHCTSTCRKQITVTCSVRLDDVPPL